MYSYDSCYYIRLLIIVFINQYFDRIKYGQNLKIDYKSIAFEFGICQYDCSLYYVNDVQIYSVILNEADDKKNRITVITLRNIRDKKII